MNSRELHLQALASPCKQYAKIKSAVLWLELVQLLGYSVEEVLGPVMPAFATDGTPELLDWNKSAVELFTTAYSDVFFASRCVTCEEEYSQKVEQVEIKKDGVARLIAPSVSWTTGREPCAPLLTRSQLWTAISNPPQPSSTRVYRTEERGVRVTRGGGVAEVGQMTGYVGRWLGSSGGAGCSDDSLSRMLWFAPAEHAPSYSGAGGVVRRAGKSGCRRPYQSSPPFSTRHKNPRWQVAPGWLGISVAGEAIACPCPPHPLDPLCPPPPRSC